MALLTSCGSSVEFSSGSTIGPSMSVSGEVWVVRVYWCKFLFTLVYFHQDQTWLNGLWISH